MSQLLLFLSQENKQRMEELQPKITQLNELMSEMKDADGIDPDELSQLQYELKEFDSRMESVNEDTAQVCFGCP
jgi:prefoldin subunit 5